MPATFSFLHFSDLHWGATDNKDVVHWPEISEPLAEKISDLKIKCQVSHWDAVFFTGDLVFRGSVNKYNEAFNRLKEIREF